MNVSRPILPSSRSRRLAAGLLLGLLLALPVVAQESAPATSASVRPPSLAIVGFEFAPGGDDRDVWMPTAIQETVAGRFRRVPNVHLIPTLRLFQARDELTGPNAPPLPWSQVAVACGADLLVQAVCGGTPSAVEIELRVLNLRDPNARPQTQQLPPTRLFKACDLLTGTIFELLPGDALRGVNLDQLFAAPTSSVATMEYYGRAVDAARERNYSRAVQYCADALRRDGDFRPAILLQSRLDLQGGAIPAAALHFRILGTRARAADDPVDQLQSDLGLSLISQVDGSWEAAETRTAAARSRAESLGDVYGQLGALNLQCDFEVARAARANDDTAEAQRRLQQAVQTQQTLLALLAQIHDRVGLMVATTKLALLEEKLENWDAALAAHEQARVLAAELNSTRHQAAALMLIGQIHRRRENWDAALAATRACLDLAEPGAKPSVQLVLGSLLLDQNDAAGGLKALEQALRGFREQKSLIDQLNCLEQIARAQRLQGRTPEAVKTLQEAIDLAHVSDRAREAALQTQLNNWQASPDSRTP